MGSLLARLSDERLPGRDRRRAVAALTGRLATTVRAAGVGALVRGRWLTDLLINVAPRIPVRALTTLRAQYPDRSDDELAEAVIASAARATAAVGAAGGALAAVEFVAPPTLLSAPAQLAAETLAVAAVEMKLIAELHEIYRAVPSGSAAVRARAYLIAWTNRRGVDPLNPAGIGPALGGAAKRQLRRRLVGRVSRNLTTMGPLLTGAVAGSLVNRRETRKLGDAVRADLRRTRHSARTA